MTQTTRLGLPLIAASQAQKHVTHNAALVLLDALTGLYLRDRDLAEPPSAPSDGDAYLVAAGASGDWAGAAGRIALRTDGVWTFLEPADGLFAWVADEERLIVRHDGTWRDTGEISALHDLDRLGVGTAADEANSLAVKAAAALFTARGTDEGGSGDLRVVFNKQSATNTLSHLFQAGYSGRAEVGLLGGDGFGVKVSADGAIWQQALSIDPASGALALGTPLALASGGTGASSASAARTALGITAANVPSTATGAIAATTVQAALAELDAEKLPLAGGTMTGNLSISRSTSAVLTLDGAAGQYRTLLLATAGSLRWRFGTDTTVETGGGTGSNFRITAYDDTGSATAINALTVTRSTQNVGIGVANAAERLEVAGNVIHAADNATSFGTASRRASVVHAATGTINTSDARMKDVRGGLGEAELRAWERVRPVVFRWHDAVADKGEAARLHAGYLAQQVAAAFAEEGLDPRRYALFCEDELLEPVRRSQTRTVCRPKTRTVRRPIERIEMREGAAVLVRGEEEVEEAVVETRPLFDESGAPVLRDDGTPAMVTLAVTEEVEESVEVVDTVVTGTRLGLRYDQCLVFEVACLRARLAKFGG